jgi:hypothetical protein
VPASHWNRPLDLIRRARHGGAVLYAFELIELKGEDLRRPIEDSKRKLSKLVRTPHPGIVLDEQYEGDGEIVFRLPYHCWAYELTKLGHQVRLMPAKDVKAYVKRNKNDAADAEAICESVRRLTMRFVQIKSVEQQARLMLLARETV